MSNSSSLNPSPRATSNSPRRVQSKIPGSSEFSVTRTPASNSARNGCSSIVRTAPVRTLLVGHTSSAIPRSRKQASSERSSTERIPCPIRSAPIRTISQTFSAVEVSPACGVKRSPPSLATATARANSFAAQDVSSPPIPKDTIPSPRRPAAHSATRSAGPPPNCRTTSTFHRTSTGARSAAPRKAAHTSSRLCCFHSTTPAEKITSACRTPCLCSEANSDSAAIP